jgi:hypothetical protein
MQLYSIQGGRESFLCPVPRGWPPVGSYSSQNGVLFFPSTWAQPSHRLCGKLPSGARIPTPASWHTRKGSKAETD